MKKLKCGICKLILAVLQFTAALVAIAGIAYAGLNMFVLASSAPSSAAFAVGVTAITLSYLAICLLSAAAISVGEGVSLFWKRGS